MTHKSTTWIDGIDASQLPKTFDVPAGESRWRKEWEVSGIHQWAQDSPRDQTFVIDTPPPTASGYLHMGHIFSYAHQDFIARYRRMCGANIYYPLGWDDNGLPTERRVQEYFHVRCDPRTNYEPGLKLTRPTSKERKSSPKVVSRANFIELCQLVTAEDEIAFKDLFERIGLSVDWRQEYSTIDQRSRAVAQRSFLDLFTKGHVYQTNAPTMWDPEFQTAVAQAEVQDRDHAGAYHDIEFGIENGGSFVISTTRPELLAACVGVAAHPDDERYKNLFGCKAITPLYHVPVPIFPSSAADPNVGSGILMVCTFGDQRDVDWWRSENLVLRQVLDSRGRFLERTYGQLDWRSLKPDLANTLYRDIIGRTVEQGRRIVVEQLRDSANSATGMTPALQGEPKPITHAVRFYERSKRPLEFLSSRQWFVRLLDKKDRLIEFGKQISWHPDYMRKRYENWVQNLQLDWAISRQRFFGVPFPLWYPLDEAGNTLFQQPISATVDSLPIDPMSDVPAGYLENQRDRPGGFTGEPDVLDTWFTSSLTPQIAACWGEQRDKSSFLLPTDLRPQAHDIIRTWAFYTIVKSMLHHDSVPWRNIMISGWVLDPDRKKMSKSGGNVVTPIGLLDQYGADPVRYWAASHTLGADTAFDEDKFKAGRRFVTKIYNASKFVLSQSGPMGAISMELDRSFLTELQTVVERSTEAYERYEYSNGLQHAEDFFWNAFTDNYIELVKRRVRNENKHDERASAIASLRLALNVLLRLFAPITPTITEEVWSWVFAKETGYQSVHKAPWPSLSEFGNITAPRSAQSFAVACEAIGAVRKAKTESEIGLGKPLSKLTLVAPPEFIEQSTLVLPDILDAANAPKADFVTIKSSDNDTTVQARIKPEVTS